MEAFMTSTRNAVVTALEGALRDHGWRVANDPTRLRAALSDLLGAEADVYRGAIDALVVSVEEAVASDLREQGRDGADRIRPGLVVRLQDWGMTADRASWVVDVWESLLPETTAAPPATTRPPPPPPPSAPLVATSLPPAPGRDGAGPAATALPPRPGAPAPPSPTSLPPAAPDPTSLPPRPPRAAAAPTPVATPVGPDDAGGPAPARSRRARWLWGATGAAVVVTAGAWGAVAATGDDGQDPGGSPTASSSAGTGSSSPSPDTAAEPKVVPAGQVLATDAATPPRAAGRFAIAGRVGGVRLTRLGPIDQVGSGDTAQVAPPGSRLIGFTVATGPCQVRPCRDVARLGLEVTVDGTTRRLPRGGPTYVVSAPEDAVVELGYAADGLDQRLSLVDGAPRGDTVEVLLRPDRTTRVGQTKVISPTVSTSSVLNPDRTVRVGRAELFFFHGRRGLERPDRAYLRIGVTYTRPGTDSEEDYEFYPSETHFEDAAGRRYEPRDLDPSESQDLVFVVPADLARGALVIGGTRRAEAGPVTYTLTIPETRFPVRFGQGD
jgi:hypothetical protein